MQLVRTNLQAVGLFFAIACLAHSAEIQGVVIDRNCGEDILKHGRKLVLNQRRDCSLMKDYVRAAYAIVTDDKKLLKLDDAGNKKALQLLKNTSDRDNLKVIITGDIEGDTIKVTDMSLL